MTASISFLSQQRRWYLTKITVDLFPPVKGFNGAASADVDNDATPTCRYVTRANGFST
jgi:hypothetical protein